MVFIFYILSFWGVNFFLSDVYANQNLCKKFLTNKVKRKPFSSLYFALIKSISTNQYEARYSNKYREFKNKFREDWVDQIRQYFANENVLYRGMGLRRQALNNILKNGIQVERSFSRSTIFASSDAQSGINYASAGSSFGSGPNLFYIFVLKHKNYWLPGYDRSGRYIEDVFVLHEDIPIEDVIGFFVFDPTLPAFFPFRFAQIK